MAEHPINSMMEKAMTNLKTMVDVNTVVGDAVSAPDGTVIIPVSTVGFGFGVGGSDFGKNKTIHDDQVMFGGGCGGGVSIKPTAFLVVGSNTVRLLPVSGSSSPVDKVIDLIPDMINKVNDTFADISKKHKEKETENSKKSDEPKTVNVIDLDD